MLVWTSSLLGKIEVYAILDKMATDQAEFILFDTKSYICENSLFYFCPCLDPVSEGVGSTRIQFWKVQSIFISHNFHVRKEYDLHHPKPDLAILDGTTTTINSCFFSIFIN
jgi:hypothetical protein